MAIIGGSYTAIIVPTVSLTGSRERTKANLQLFSHTFSHTLTPIIVFM